MPNDFVLLISEYGYLAIFLLIFAQEVGLPSPVPNEVLLIFSGYLTFIGVLSIPIVVLFVILADFLAGSVLYWVFRYFGQTILNKKPKWLPIPLNKIQKISDRIQTEGHSGVFIGRLTPLIRGYVSVACGLFQFSGKKYFSILTGTSTIWASLYVIVGFFIAPYWNLLVNNNTGSLEFYLALFAGGVVAIAGIIFLFKKYIFKINLKQ